MASSFIAARAVCPLATSLAKLEARTPLSTEAREAFLALPYRRRDVSSHRDLVREGDRTLRCHFLERGFVSRSKSVPDGRRQIVSFHIDGDLIDLNASLILVADHTIRTHEACSIVDISALDILRLVAEYPEIGRALWFDTLVEASIFREWALNLGRRAARERTAHLLLELGARSEKAGLGALDRFHLPLTQSDLADALGLTPIHVNRSLRALREAGYLTIERRVVTIPDVEALATMSAFRPLYLHPEGPRELSS
jgi:CRP-like cAMP-binding protein